MVATFHCKEEEEDGRGAVSFRKHLSRTFSMLTTYYDMENGQIQNFLCKCSLNIPAFDGRSAHVSSSFHNKQQNRKRKSLSSAPKCTCCNLKTGSTNSEEQTKTILTHTLRELVPKLSRICIGQKPFSSSQIWTADKKPPEWPNDKEIKWKDPNNNPKDSLDVLQRKMEILLGLCRGKKLNIPDEYEREINAYLNVRDDLKDNKSPDISTLQIYRQQRKKSHELALACRHFSEMVKWHGAPQQSQFLENELLNLCVQLKKARSEKMNMQFEEIYCAIAQAEGSEKSPHDFMQQFENSHAGRKAIEDKSFPSNYTPSPYHHGNQHHPMIPQNFPLQNHLEVHMTETEEFYTEDQKWGSTMDVCMEKRFRGNSSECNIMKRRRTCMPNGYPDLPRLEHYQMANQNFPY
ncbi:hypothetical protein FSP39_007174 [Pinctada imbricata]|uniref:Uncharacterized protein n=1 Tax=Pinctada imbricata TaxID=66713 RepID=A0AA88XCR1_PINIB|nr:hypothetical protein FSP39_007174 [Pinctada imbricata]